MSLCLLFEKLLQTHEPQLWSHFRELQIQPYAIQNNDICIDKLLILILFFRIRVVFKWLIRAFSGHLQPDELLILWDLVKIYIFNRLIAVF